MYEEYKAWEAKMNLSNGYKNWTDIADVDTAVSLMGADKVDIIEDVENDCWAYAEAEEECNGLAQMFCWNKKGTGFTKEVKSAYKEFRLVPSPHAYPDGNMWCIELR